MAAAHPSPAARNGWQRWMWFPARNRNWLLNHPLLWRSGLLWLPGFALALGLAFAALAAWQPLAAHALPVSPVPTTAGLLMYLVAWPAYLIWTLVPRSRHPLGPRRWQHHLVTFATAYLGALILVMPLILYDGLFSRRVAALLPPPTVAQAQATLQALEVLPCGEDWKPRATLLANTLQQQLQAGGVVSVKLTGASTCDRQRAPEVALLFGHADGSAGSQGQWIVGLQRIADEQAAGRGGASSHAVNVALGSLVRRQVGCLAFALLPVLLDLWVQFVRSRGLRWPGIAGEKIAWLAAARRRMTGPWHTLLVTRPELWACKGSSFVVACVVLAAGAFGLQALFSTERTDQQVFGVATLLALLITLAGVWHWQRVAGVWPLPTHRRGAWRGYLAAVAVAVAAAYGLALVAPAQLLTDAPALSLGAASAYIAIILLAGAHVVATAAITQATRGPLLLTSLLLCYTLGGMVSILVPPFGAPVLLPLWTAAAAVVWGARRSGGFAGRRWAGWAARLQIALAPLAATSLLVSLQHLVETSAAGPSLLGNYSGASNLALLAALVLTLGWLITPAMEGLLQIRDDPA